MGWLWNSSPPQKGDLPVTPSPPSLQQPTETTGSSTSPPPPKLTREEQADAEFKQLLASLEGDINGSKKTSQQSQSSSAPDSAPGATPSPPSSIAPESLYSDEMSCRSAFDYAFFCQSFGGQFVNVYRYGELRSCSEHWDNFWHCMKVRTWGDESRRKAIREYNRKKAIKYKTGPSSEDVWDLRMEPVRNAFEGDFAALEREMKAEEEASQKASAAAGAV